MGLLKRNWKLQCLVCMFSRKRTNKAFIVCANKKSFFYRKTIYYGSDLFTGEHGQCDKAIVMENPFNPEKGDTVR